MKFESHWISFDGGSLPIKRFSLKRGGFTPFMLVSPYLLVIQCCVIAQILRKGHVYKSL